MPIYEYKCKKCRRVTEKWFKINEIQDRIKCVCGKTAKKVISHGAIKTDGDVKWLESARMTLQPDYERPLTTRGEYNKYLKNKGLESIG